MLCHRQLRVLWYSILLVHIKRTRQSPVGFMFYAFGSSPKPVAIEGYFCTVSLDPLSMRSTVVDFLLHDLTRYGEVRHCHDLLSIDQSMTK